MSQEHLDCTAAREAVHASLDAELMDASARQGMERHLAGCNACREFAVETRAARDPGTLRRRPPRW